MAGALKEKLTKGDDKGVQKVVWVCRLVHNERITHAFGGFLVGGVLVPCVLT